MSCVTIIDNEVRLSSNMDENAFGKTSYSSIVTQTGILASCDSYETGKYHFSFTDWSFGEVKSFSVPERENRIVFYCGENPVKDGSVLLDLLKSAEALDADKAEKSKALEAQFVICSILTQAALEKIKFPVIGAGGIIIHVDGINTKVLFLPENLFKYAAAGIQEKDSSELNIMWVNPTLLDLPAICFERAVFAYKLLTGRYPFPSTDLTERNADILDRKFLPVEMIVENIDSDLAQNINKGLKLNSNAVEIPGKKKKGKSSEDLTPTPQFPTDKLYSALKEVEANPVNVEAMEEKAKSFLKAQASRVKTKRRLRRNTTTIITTLIILVILGGFTYNAISTRLNEFNSKGLTSVETVEMFYKSINDKDTIMMQNITKGKKASKYSTTLSQIYVVGKQRKAYYQDQGYLAPEGWLLYAKNPELSKHCGVYGVSALRIDGKPSDIAPEMHKKKDKVEPVTQENGITLKKNDKSVHTAEYFLIHTEGEDADLVIDFCTETITLTYLKDKWMITDLETKVENVEVNSNLFKTEYFNLIKQNGGDAVKSAVMLSGKYPWVPDEPLLKAEQHRLDELAKDPFGSIFK